MPQYLALTGSGIALLNESLRRSCAQADAYQLQAAIAAEHARAASSDDTDWTEILRLDDTSSHTTEMEVVEDTHG